MKDENGADNNDVNDNGIHADNNIIRFNYDDNNDRRIVISVK